MFGMVSKGYGLYVALAIVSAIVSFVGSAVFGSVLGLMIFVVFVLLMYAEGCARGEHACSVRDTLARLEKDGKTADSKLAKQTWNKADGIKAFLCLTIPLIVLAVINLIMADTTTSNENIIGVISRIIFLPFAFITRICAESVKYNTEAVQALSAAIVGAFDYGTVNINAVSDAVSSAGTLAYAYDLSPLTIMRILFIPASMIPPAAMLIGYLRGPKLREKTISDMLKGTRKKRKKLKVFGKGRQSKQAKPEV